MRLIRHNVAYSVVSCSSVSLAVPCTNSHPLSNRPVLLFATCRLSGEHLTTDHERRSTTSRHPSFPSAALSAPPYSSCMTRWSCRLTFPTCLPLSTHNFVFAIRTGLLSSSIILITDIIYCRKLGCCNNRCLRFLYDMLRERISRRSWSS